MMALEVVGCCDELVHPIDIAVFANRAVETRPIVRAMNASLLPVMLNRSKNGLPLSIGSGN